MVVSRHAHARAADTRLFWRVTAAFVVGAPLAWFVVPILFALVAHIPARFPFGARASLVAAWLTLLFATVTAMNLVRTLRNEEPIDFKVPPAFIAWLRLRVGTRQFVFGCVALISGYVIDTTIFR